MYSKLYRFAIQKMESKKRDAESQLVKSADEIEAPDNSNETWAKAEEETLSERR